jgi:ABC-type Fe3+-siderophore transport system permease subunit
LVSPPKPSRIGGDGATGAGAGFGAGFFFFFAGVAFFIPFFLRAGPRFAFLDFLATFSLPIGSIKTRHHTAAAYLNVAVYLIGIAVVDYPQHRSDLPAVCGPTNGLR